MLSIPTEIIIKEKDERIKQLEERIEKLEESLRDFLDALRNQESWQKKVRKVLSKK